MAMMTAIDLDRFVRDELVDATAALVLDAADRHDLCVDAFFASGLAEPQDGAAAPVVLIRSAFGSVELVVDGTGTTWMVASTVDLCAPKVMRLCAWHDARFLADCCMDSLCGGKTFRPTIH
jgi:hypothetical protein